MATPARAIAHSRSVRFVAVEPEEQDGPQPGTDESWDAQRVEQKHARAQGCSWMEPSLPSERGPFADLMGLAVVAESFASERGDVKFAHLASVAKALAKALQSDDADFFTASCGKKSVLARCIEYVGDASTQVASGQTKQATGQALLTLVHRRWASFARSAIQGRSKLSVGALASERAFWFLKTINNTPALATLTRDHPQAFETGWLTFEGGQQFADALDRVALLAPASFDRIYAEKVARVVLRGIGVRDAKAYFRA
jgi:hypothetical protein